MVGCVFGSADERNLKIRGFGKRVGRWKPQGYEGKLWKKEQVRVFKESEQDNVKEHMETTAEPKNARNVKVKLRIGGEMVGTSRIQDRF